MVFGTLRAACSSAGVCAHHCRLFATHTQYSDGVWWLWCVRVILFSIQARANFKFVHCMYNLVAHTHTFLVACEPCILLISVVVDLDSLNTDREVI
jgi:hypothetical protein